jgi:hypothetical protein
MDSTKLRLHPVCGLLVLLSSCAVSDDAPTTRYASDLLVSNWGASTTLLDPAWSGGQVGTVNGTSYVVSTGTCGSWLCGGDLDANQLYAQQLPLAVHESAVAGQSSDSKVSLANFNGLLYMVHAGGDGSGSTWISRMDPATQAWSTNYQIPYTSFGGPPAIVAYNNLLYFIGTGPYPYAMWYATMTADESFSSPQAILGHASASRPSAAVLYGVLYFAHRWGSTGDVVYGTFDGTTWTPPAHVPGGDAGGPVRAVEAAIAVDNDILHLVHLRPEGDNLVWWTYFDGCDWAGSEVSIGTMHSTLDPSLAPAGNGLVMLTTSDNSDIFFGVWSRNLLTTRYVRPRRLILPPPTCPVGVHGP